MIKHFIGDGTKDAKGWDSIFSEAMRVLLQFTFQQAGLCWPVRNRPAFSIFAHFPFLKEGKIIYPNKTIKTID
ncbi:hypothetical protein GCM10023229_29050 [Flavisolibacter ginsenosidimutans]